MVHNENDTTLSRECPSTSDELAANLLWGRSDIFDSGSSGKFGHYVGLNVGLNGYCFAIEHSIDVRKYLLASFSRDEIFILPYLLWSPA